MGTELHSSRMIGDSRRLKRCERAMLSAVAAIRYRSNSIAISNNFPAKGKPKIGHTIPSIKVKLMLYIIVYVNILANVMIAAFCVESVSIMVFCWLRLA